MSLLALPVKHWQRGQELDLKELFGSSLRQCRRARGLTRAQLAEATELSLEMVGRLERGRTAPSFDTIAALANALKVPAAALFGAKPTGLRAKGANFWTVLTGCWRKLRMTI